mgnify:CR=1 FL=1
MRDYAKARVKALGLAGPGRVRVNQAGCLDRCAAGPVVVAVIESLDPAREWLAAGITGLARGREWDAVATAEAIAPR